MLQIPVNFILNRDNSLKISDSIDGHLTFRERNFIFMLGAIKTAMGEVLEIGSFKGRSTFLLWKGAQLAGDKKIFAVDPLTLPAETDPKESKEIKEEFYNNIKNFGVMVDFSEMLSEELANKWQKPLRLLWIDGDHTYIGAQKDFLNFAKFLQPGAIIAFHDVFNGHTGPLQVFIHEVVQNKNYGACGIVGSIGWAQYIGKNKNDHFKEKEKLYIKLLKLLPHINKLKRSRWDKFQFKLKRSFIPHSEISVEEWIRQLELISSN
jgi:predicted O-methyltransferase YrrM